MSHEFRPLAEKLGYLAHVDGARALAIALVVIYHAWPTVLSGGFIGVDVFFVISGFIITRRLIADMDDGVFTFSGFLARRARRLVPAAFVCCLLVTAAAVVILMPDRLIAFSRSLAASWLMAANFFFYASTGYFDPASAETPLLHMWSLAVEDQFYLTWPLLLLVLHRSLRSRKGIVGAVFFLAIISLLYSHFSALIDTRLAFYLPFSRAFELLAGCGLALTLPILKPVGRHARAIMGFVGLSLILASAFVLHPDIVFSPDIRFPGFAALPVVVGSVLIIWCGLDGPSPVANLLSMRPVVLIGRMSYSIYLYHWPIMALATYHIGREPRGIETFALVVLGVALGALSWVFVEQRLTRRLRLYELPTWDVLKRTGVATATICLLAIIGLVSRGLPQRLDAPAHRVYRSASALNAMRPKCDGYENVFGTEDKCTFGRPLAPGQSYDIAVFGDSNADHFVSLVASLAEKAGLSGRQVTQSTCGALLGASRLRPAHLEAPCTRYQEAVLAFLERNPGLKIAVLGSQWSNYDSAETNRFSAEPPGEIKPFAYFARFMVEELRKRGIKVMVIGQVPPFEAFSLACFARAARQKSETTSCLVPRVVIDRALAPSQDAFATLARDIPGVSFLDMRRLLCNETTCSAFKDGVLIYRDRSHINAIGSEYLARYASLPPIGN